MKTNLFACLVVLLVRGGLHAQPTAPNSPPEPLRGTLVIAGGGKLPEAAALAFLKLAGADQGRIVVIPAASEAVDKADPTAFVGGWSKRTKAAIHVLHTRERDRANDPDFVKPLREATGVWIDGGDQRHLTAAYRGALVEKE